MRVKNINAKKCCRAFTLVELALTTVVIGIGLLAVMMLGRMGLQAATESEQDARCTLLANDIFATLRAASDEACATGGPQAFVDFWTTLRDDPNAGLDFPVAATPALTNLFALTPPENLIRGGGVASRVLIAVYDTSLPMPLHEWSAQFWLNVDLHESRISYDGVPNIVYLSLNIRPDAYSTRVPARSFYTHIAARHLWP
jgi:type II secretory pathway pseudopilin PulG